jgi:hypothetical protein
VNVAELIAALQGMPQDAEVAYQYDGELRASPDVVWLGRNGIVGIGTDHEPIYSTESRPIDAPSEKAAPFWCPGER